MNSELELLYEDYLDKVDYLEKNRKLGEGIFGLKGGPADNPCHDRFAEDLDGFLTRFSESGPETDEILDVLRRIYFAPKQHVNLRTAYWMLQAVQGMTIGLIELLPKESAGELLKQYCKEYPRWERLPVQQKVIAALKNQSTK